MKIQCLTVDATNPEKLADFWAKVLGWKVHSEENGNEFWIENPDTSNSYPDILFLQSSDKKQVKNRLHLDLRPANQQIEVERVKSLGAIEIDIGQNSDSDTTWVVMADPEGNEFCILKALA